MSIFNPDKILDLVLLKKNPWKKLILIQDLPIERKITYELLNGTIRMNWDVNVAKFVQTIHEEHSVNILLAIKLIYLDLISKLHKLYKLYIVKFTVFAVRSLFVVDCQSSRSIFFHITQQFDLVLKLEILLKKTVI